MVLPFSFDVVPEEVHLKEAPLIRVLCQIRYSATPELVEAEAERALAEAVAADYPVRGSVQGVTIQFGEQPVGVQELYRTYEDVAGQWKVTVAPEFVALETSNYEKRDDFLSRLSRVLQAIDEVRRPPQVQRVGIRYTDRVENPSDLTSMVNPALLGWLPNLNDDSVLEHQIVQVLLRHPATGHALQVRSLCLPPGVIFDGTIPPVDTSSWVLDVDAYDEHLATFDVQALSATARALAERSYQVFYWSVSDAFRDRYRADAEGETA
jgi:uncharacterized protein (TIGR04255 family)